MAWPGLWRVGAWRAAAALAGLVAGASGALGGVDAVAARPLRASCHAGWVMQDRASLPGALSGLAVTGTGGAWAVGSQGSSRLRTLTVRWSGTAWRVAPSPDTNWQLDLLGGVAAVSAQDAWAVGGAGAMSGTTASALVEHWNGLAWTVASIPNAGQELTAVTAVTASNVWAVGNSGVYSFRGPMQTFALHWTGRAWVAVSTQNPGEYNSLSGLASVPGDGQLWAVGSQQSSDTAAVEPLVERWTGTRWTLVSTPVVAGGRLSAVAAVSTRDAWAVGVLDSNTGVVRAPLVLRWDGRRWTRVRVPPGTGPLDAVAARSAGDLWAVGGSTILHWTGVRWVTVHWQAPTGADLSAVAVAGGPRGSQVWVAGSWHTPARPLIITGCG